MKTNIEDTILQKVKSFFNDYKLINFGRDVEFAALECKRFIGFDFFNDRTIFFNYKLSAVNQPPNANAEIILVDDNYNPYLKITLDFSKWEYNVVYI